MDNKFSGKITLSDTQKNNIIKALNDKKSCRLILTYDQLKASHEGGFIPLAAGIPLVFGTLGAIMGGVQLANNISTNKQNIEQLKRRNDILESYLLKTPVKEGSGIKQLIKSNDKIMRELKHQNDLFELKKQKIEESSLKKKAKK